MSEAPLLAADSNVLLGYAEEDETVIDCFDILKRRLSGVRVLIPPTVLHELAFFAAGGDTARTGRTARRAMGALTTSWGFQPVNLVPVGHGIVLRVAQTLRDKGLIPPQEVNDSYIVAEAALLNVSILLSSDTHLTTIAHADLRLVMDRADVRAPLIASPWKIVQEFFR